MNINKQFIKFSPAKPGICYFTEEKNILFWAAFLFKKKKEKVSMLLEGLNKKLGLGVFLFY